MAGRSLNFAYFASKNPREKSIKSLFQQAYKINTQTNNYGELRRFEIKKYFGLLQCKFSADRNLSVFWRKYEKSVFNTNAKQVDEVDDENLSNTSTDGSDDSSVDISEEEFSTSSESASSDVSSLSETDIDSQSESENEKDSNQKLPDDKKKIELI